MRILLKRSRPALVVAIAVLALTMFFYKVWSYEGFRFFGDEPHYLLMTRSIILDHDLNLKNDYAEPSRYKDFYTGTLDTHLSSGARSGPPSYSIHGAGLPIILVPALRYGGTKGVVAFMALWAAICCVLAWFWTDRHLCSPFWSSLSVGALAGSISFLTLAGHVFPDIVIATLLLAVALILSAPRPRAWHYMMLGVIVGSLPWIHVKTVMAAGIITAIVGVRLWRGQRDQIWPNTLAFMAPAVLLLGLYELSLWSWYHTLWPNRAFSSANQLFQISPVVSIGAGLFDGVKGLLINNPGYVFIFIGLPLWWRLNRSTFWLALGLALPFLALQSTFNDWAGGWSPSGRYWLEFLPLLLPSLGYAFTRISQWWWRGFGAIALAAQLKFVSIYLRAKPPWQLTTDPNPVFTVIGRDHHLNLAHLTPNFSARVSLSSWLETGLFTVVLLLLMTIAYRLGSEGPVKTKRL